ncbi:hypothetical protein [Dictyobacter formicarum]|uniref:Lipoprotein n=1 Tax=Dictyobacter formicarum TaxID=2778368 RepID=A0ABQ3VCA5_9CHLR|nr:hypothetical protein [Dictyobacter formicarum]GHO83394.1 hypothetical protein KSZ_14000 [Dictyobacter formicarum]
MLYIVSVRRQQRGGFHSLFRFGIMAVLCLLILSGCDFNPSQLLVPAASTVTPTAKSVTHTTSSQDASQLQEAYQQARHDLARKFAGPNGWTWSTNLPGHRLVLFYGNPLSSEMGPIGRYSDDELIAKLNEQAQVYADLDPMHPVVPGIDYVTPVVQPSPMADNTWTYRMPDESISHYIDVANSHHALFFFDMQVGHSSVQHEVEHVWQYLRQPGVELSLDPEFDMPPGAIPDQVFGHMNAAEINWTIDKLSQLVSSEHLPPKILIVHQFLRQMLPDWQNIRTKPGVQLVTCVDGFGPPNEKIDDYRVFDKEQLIQYPGMKLFYKLDNPLMTPQQTLALDPSPLMVMYQ